MVCSSPTEGVLPHFWVTGENGKEAKKKKNKIPTAANTLYFFYFYLLTLEMVCLDCLYMLDLSRHFFFFSSGAAIIRCVWRKEPSARVYQETSEMSVLTGAIYSFFVVVFVCGPFQFFFKAAEMVAKLKLFTSIPTVQVKFDGCSPLLICFFTSK